MEKRPLRSGYTTGACAAASAKAAAELLIKKFLSNSVSQKTFDPPRTSTINLPDGNKATFKINKSSLEISESEIIANASTIKFAGDDPDVTNGAEIIASVIIETKDFQISNLPTTAININETKIIIEGGRGVGIITKPGLPLPIGCPAINPVPQRMIKDAILDVFQQASALGFSPSKVKVIISVTDGEKLALKTLNPRLGIIGGISILGTTGIVKPLSAEAWTATISTSMDVAVATGCNEVVLSAGRTSEKAHLKKYSLPEESYIMMGDYLEYSISEAKRHGFKKIHICSQWAKMLKIAMSTPHTHVRYGAINIKKAIKFLNKIGIIFPMENEPNTAREIFEIINSSLHDPISAFKNVCYHAKKYSETLGDGAPVICHLVSYDGEIIVSL